MVDAEAQSQPPAVELTRAHREWLRFCQTLPPEPKLMEGMRVLGDDSDPIAQVAAEQLLSSLGG